MTTLDEERKKLAELQQQQIEQQQFERDRAVQAQQQAALETQAAAQQPGQQQQQPTQQQPTQQQSTQPSPDGANLGAAASQQDGDDLISQVQSGQADVGDYLRFGREMGAATVQGGVDFGVSLFNAIVPGEKFDIKPEWYQKGPLAPNKNEAASVLRKMGELAVGERILTTIGLGQLQKTRSAAIAKELAMKPGVAKRILSAVNNSAFAKWASKFGITGLASVAAVDVSTQAEEDNALGTLKQTWPKQFGWLPDGLASGEHDSPDTKRDKNRLEAIAFHGLSLPIEFAASLYRSAKGVKTATQWIPKSEQALEVAEKLNTANRITGDEAVDNLVTSIERQSKDLDDYGAWQLSKLEEAGRQIDEPVKGVHQMFDWEELGIRTRDPGGVIGASLDDVRIQKNLGSWNGRIGNMISKAALKFGLDADNLKQNWILGKILKEYELGKDIDAVLPDGSKVSAALREKLNLDLYGSLISPRTSSAQIVKQLQDFSITAEGGIKVIGKDAEAAVQLAIRRYNNDYLNLSKYRAEALALDSFNGQISDASKTIHQNMDTMNIENMMDDVLDRLEALTIMKAASDWQAGTFLQNKGWWKEFAKNPDPKKFVDFEKQQAKAKAKAMNEIVGKGKQFVNTIREISEQRPEFLKPLFEMYDATDGRVHSMSLLNKEVQNSLGNLSKAFYDQEPEIPQMILQRWAGTMYNSILSGFGTAFDVTLGSIQGIADNFVNINVGALMMGKEGKAILSQQRAALTGMMDTTAQAMGHARTRIWQGWTDPDALDSAMRPDLYMQSEEKMEALKTFAETAAANGNEGPLLAFRQLEAMDAMQKDPVFRMIPNFMVAVDTFQGAFVADQLAKVKAYEKVYGSIDDKVAELIPTTGDLKAKWGDVHKEIYDELYTSDGLLKRGTEADYLQKQAAMQLNTPIANAFNTWTAAVPPLRTLLPFPKTMGNAAQVLVNYTPVNAFFDKVGAFNRPLSSLSFEYMENALAARGMDNLAPEDVLGTFMRERARVRGRLATGGLLVTSFSTMALAGNMTGAGNRNLDVKRQRQKYAPDYSIKVGDKWISYEGLGPVAKLIGLIPTAVENFGEMRTGAFEDLNGKLGFTLASMFEDANLFSALKPLSDLASGKADVALQRYLAQTANSGIPLAGQRREWGRLLNSTIRVYEKDMADYMRNSNTWTDLFVPAAKLPELIDPVTGKKVGQQSPLMRMFNTYSPFTVSDDPDPNRSFLIKIEWDGKDIVSRSSNGVKLNTTEQAQIWQLIGEEGQWAKDIEWIRKRAQDFNYIQKLRKLRRSNVTTETLDSDDFLDIQTLINESLRAAIRRAEIKLSSYGRLEQEAYRSDLNRYQGATGQSQFYEEVDGILQLTRP